MLSIYAHQALLIFTKWSDGSRYVLETEIQPYTAAEVQHLIDSTVSAKCSVTAVICLDLETGKAEYITDSFDVPEVPAYVGTYRPITYSTLHAAE